MGSGASALPTVRVACGRYRAPSEIGRAGGREVPPGSVARAGTASTPTPASANGTTCGRGPRRGIPAPPPRCRCTRGRDPRTLTRLVAQKSPWASPRVASGGSPCRTTRVSRRRSVAPTTPAVVRSSSWRSNLIRDGAVDRRDRSRRAGDAGSPERWASDVTAWRRPSRSAASSTSSRVNRRSDSGVPATHSSIVTRSTTATGAGKPASPNALVKAAARAPRTRP